jgi:transcriptional regulator
MKAPTALWWPTWLARIRPTWYAAELAVPTWNYTAVHATGTPRLIAEPERIVAMMEEIIEFFEAPRPDRWPGALPAEYRDKMIGAIVAFEIEITRVEGKYKLSQNRPAEDIDQVIAALSQSADQTEREVAEMMRRGRAAADTR